MIEEEIERPFRLCAAKAAGANKQGSEVGLHGCSVGSDDALENVPNSGQVTTKGFPSPN